MKIFFKALGLDFEAEVDYTPETPDDNEYITFDVLECEGRDALFLLKAADTIVTSIEAMACFAAAKALKAHNDDMALDAFIANHEDY